MAQTFQSGFKTTLWLALAPWDTTATLSTVPTVTKGRFYAKNDDQEERISFTGVSGSTITWLTRSLSQTADPATWGTWLTWVAWTLFTLVAMHDQIDDALETTTITGEKTFTEPIVTTEWVIATSYASTATRDSALWGDWVATRNYMNIKAGAAFYNYNLSTGLWEIIDTGTTPPDMTESVAGIAEWTTEAEFLARTDNNGSNSLVPKPSDIKKILQTRLTAWEDMTAWLWAYVDIDWKAYKWVRQSSTAAQIGSITGVDTTSSFKMIKVEYLSDNKAICIYKKASDDIIYWTVVTFLRWAITVGTEQAISSALSATWWVDMCILSSSLFVVGYIKNASNPYAVACTVSWTTITAGSEAACAWSSAPEASSTISICKCNATAFWLALHASTSDDPEVVIWTISWTTITAGTAVAMEAVTMTAGSSPLIQYVANNVLLLVYNNWTNIKALTMTVSWTVPTGWSWYDTAVAWATREGDQLIQIDWWYFILCLNQYATWISGIMMLNIPNTSTNSTPVWWGVYSAYVAPSDTTTAFYQSNFYYLGNNKLAWLTWVTSGSDMRLRIFELWYHNIRKWYDTTIAWTVGDLACCQLLTDQSKILMIYRDTGTTNLNYSLYWNTENQSIGIVWTTVLAAAATAITAVWAETLSTTYTAWLPYYFADAGLIATSGTKQIGRMLSTTSLLLS